MLLIAQIILTVVAWQKGWKAYALIPGGSAFFIGMMIGMSGGDIGPASMVVDTLALVALIVMSLNKRDSNK